MHEGETVVTFRNGEAQLHMLDGANYGARELANRDQAYVADGGDKDRSIVDLIKGTVRSITGWIGKYNRAEYERSATSNLVTIGVPGTDQEVTDIPPDAIRAASRALYDKVNEGETFSFRQ